jgi:hypothetical protein
MVVPRPEVLLFVPRERAEEATRLLGLLDELPPATTNGHSDASIDELEEQADEAEEGEDGEDEATTPAPPRNDRALYVTLAIGLLAAGVALWIAAR